MAKPLNSILKEICAASLDKLLLPDGFEVTPSTARHSLVSAQYHRFAVDRLCMVDVQRDKYWTHEKGRFCVNLWIQFPAVGDFAGMDAVPRCRILRTFKFSSVWVNSPPAVTTGGS